MPGATPTYGLTYPILGEQPHGPNQIEALAQGVDTLLNGTYKTERDNAITAALTVLLNNDAGYAEIVTAQATTSTSYADLATVGPTVNLTSQGTKALVFFGFQGDNSTPANGAAAGVEITGATTFAAADDRAVGHNVGNSGFGFYACNFFLVTITPGAHQYRMKYRVGGTTGTFGRRKLWVLAP